MQESQCRQRIPVYSFVEHEHEHEHEQKVRGEMIQCSPLSCPDHELPQQFMIIPLKYPFIEVSRVTYG